MPGAAVPAPLDPVKNPTSVKDGATALQPNSGAAPTGAGPAGPVTAATAAATASIQIDPPEGCSKASDQNPIFSISDAPRMPSLNVTFKVIGVAGADPSPTTDFSWTAAVSFDSSKCPSGLHKGTDAPRIIAAVSTTGTSKGGKVNIDLDKIGSIRGGDLKISVTATVGGQIIKGETKGWRVQGTNPSKAIVGAEMADDTHRKIACLESMMQQFFPAPNDGNAMYPYFSGDRLLGVGICQLTYPQPTDDQIWNWKENVAAGLRLYNEKKRAAIAYPAQVEKSKKFTDLVTKYNQSLKAQSAAAALPGPGASPAPAGTAPATPPATAPGTPPPGPAAPAAPAAPVAQVQVTVPEFTADQVEEDTIRGFNGWGGDEGFVNPKQLHEYRIVIDKASGNLVVDGDAKTGKVKAKWEKVPVADRPGSGDPNYVEDVKKRDPKTCAKGK